MLMISIWDLDEQFKMQLKNIVIYHITLLDSQ
jgi:hypothetical protein